MKIEHKQVNFEDNRGTITDIFTNNPKDHCTIIFTKKGGVRGNHYHKESAQTDFIVSGKMQIFSKLVDGGTVEVAEVEKNDLITWVPGEAHEFVALEDTIFITFVEGPRGGDDYENDTFRLDVPLHEEAGVVLPSAS